MAPAIKDDAKKTALIRVFIEKFPELKWLWREHLAPWILRFQACRKRLRLVRSWSTVQFRFLTFRVTSVRSGGPVHNRS